MSKNALFAVFVAGFLLFWLKVIHDHDAMETHEQTHGFQREVQDRLSAVAQGIQALERQMAGERGGAVAVSGQNGGESIAAGVSEDIQELKRMMKAQLSAIDQLKVRIQNSQDRAGLDAIVKELADISEAKSAPDEGKSRKEAVQMLKKIRKENESFEKGAKVKSNSNTKKGSAAAAQPEPTEGSVDVNPIAAKETSKPLSAPTVRVFSEGIYKWQYDPLLRSYVPEEQLELSGMEERMKKVVEATKFSWQGYKQVAFGQDEYSPTSGRPKQWLSGAMGLTIVDALDTLYIMGLMEEFKECREWVATKLAFNRTRDSVSTFETTIRELGGLLGAYELSRDRLFLEKAQDLGNRLATAFDTSSGIPRNSVSLQGASAARGGSISVAEAGTLQLEFTYLAYHTGEKSFAEKALRVYEVINGMTRVKGLYPTMIDFNSGKFRNKDLSLDAEGDSFYEYMLKLWLLTGKQNDVYRKRYDEMVENIIRELVHTNKYYTFLSQSRNGMLRHEMGHLSCFAAGMFALGAADAPNPNQDMQLAKDLGYTCYMMYKNSPSGVSAEGYSYDATSMRVRYRQYILRPEAAEAMFILYRLTGERRWQDYGWEMFQAIDKHCKTTYGYTELSDAYRNPPRKGDFTNSFWFGETLFYFFLLFAPPDAYPLREYVLNTEAHPLGTFPLQVEYGTSSAKVTSEQLSGVFHHEQLHNERFSSTRRFAQ